MYNFQIGKQLGNCKFWTALARKKGNNNHEFSHDYLRRRFSNDQERTQKVYKYYIWRQIFAFLISFDCLRRSVWTGCSKAIQEQLCFQTYFWAIGKHIHIFYPAPILCLIELAGNSWILLSTPCMYNCWYSYSICTKFLIPDFFIFFNFLILVTPK